MGFNLYTNVKCNILRNSTNFDMLLGFGGNTHCPPIRVGRSRNLVRSGAHLFLVSYSQLFAYQCF